MHTFKQCREKSSKSKSKTLTSRKVDSTSYLSPFATLKKPKIPHLRTRQVTESPESRVQSSLKIYPSPLASIAKHLIPPHLLSPHKKPSTRPLPLLPISTFPFPFHTPAHPPLQTLTQFLVTVHITSHPHPLAKLNNLSILPIKIHFTHGIAQ